MNEIVTGRFEGYYFVREIVIVWNMPGRYYVALPIMFFEMISRMISEVPSPIVFKRASRQCR
jgi:hypothetical protein